jgi:hypothetical protein
MTIDGEEGEEREENCQSKGGPILGRSHSFKRQAWAIFKMCIEEPNEVDS